MDKSPSKTAESNQQPDCNGSPVPMQPMQIWTPQDSQFETNEKLQPREREYPSPSGHISGLEWGNPNAPNKILCIHGWLDNVGSFEPLVPHLLNIGNNADEYHVVAFDQLGLGDSSYRPPGAECTVFSTVMDMRRLLEHLGWREVDLVGHSHGGHLSLLYASLYAEQVRSVVFIDRPYPFLRLEQDWAGWLARSMEQQFKWEYNFIDDPTVDPSVKPLTELEARKILISGHLNSLRLDSAKILLKRGAKRYPNGLAFTRDRRLKIVYPSEVMWDERLVPEFVDKCFRANLFLVQAKQSPWPWRDCWYQKFADILQRVCPIFRELITDGGHHVHMEIPELLATKIDSFLSDARKLPKAVKVAATEETTAPTKPLHLYDIRPSEPDEGTDNSKPLPASVRDSSLYQLIPRERAFPNPYGHTAGLEWGKADAPNKILCTHGWLDNSGSFEPLVSHLLALGENANQYHIVSIDSPGMGLSSHKPIGADYTSSSLMVEMHRVLQALNWDKVTIVAHSLGAHSALVYSCVYADQVDALILLDASVPITSAVEDWQETLSNTIDEYLKVDMDHEDKQAAARTYDEAIELLMRNNLSPLSRESAKILLKRGMRQSDTGYYLNRDIRHKYPPAELRPTDDNMCAFLAVSFRPKLMTIDAERSPYHRPERIRQRYLDIYRQNCPLFRQVKLASSCHHVHLESPELVAPEISSFLEEIRSPIHADP